MTTPQYVHTCHDIPDLLGLLPTLFGFVPDESVIAIAVDGPRSRLGFRLRMDLPSRSDAGDVSGLVSWHIRQRGADAVILIIRTEDQGLAEHQLGSLSAAIQPLPVRLAVTATSTHYWSWENGITIADGQWDCQSFSPAVAHAVCAGQQIVASRADLEARYAAVNGQLREQMSAATDRAVADVASICWENDGGDSRAVRRAGRGHLMPLLDRALTENSLLDGDQLAAVTVWVSIADVRDEVLRDISRENAEAHAQLWTHVAQHVVPPFEAPVLTLAGFSRWLCGDGTQALIAIERALAADADFPFAQTLMEALRNGLDPRIWDSF